MAQHVVDHAETVDDRGVLADDLLDPVVRDGDQRIGLVLEAFGRLLGHEAAPRAFPAEGFRDHGDGKRADVLGDLGDDRCGARAGAAAHARRDEDHVRVLQRLVDLLGVLLRGTLADGRIAARPEAARDLVADADLVRRVRLEERLRVRVHGDELHAHELGSDHPVDRVGPAASDPDDADQREVLGIRPQRHRSLPSLAWPGGEEYSRVSDPASLFFPKRITTERGVRAPCSTMPRVAQRSRGGA